MRFKQIEKNVKFKANQRGNLKRKNTNEQIKLVTE